MNKNEFDFIEAILDSENFNNIIINYDGEDIEFEQVFFVEIEDAPYCLLRPVDGFKGMIEEGLFAFGIREEDDTRFLEMIDDEDLSDEIFKIYNEKLDEELDNIETEDYFEDNNDKFDEDKINEEDEKMQYEENKKVMSGKCRTCRYFTKKKNPPIFGRDGYCGYYNAEKNSDTKACDNYEKDEERCFIVTACCTYKNLDNYCYELITIRNFRDSVIQNNEDLNPIINEYYNIAPIIVKNILKNDKANKIFEDIYDNLVLPCVNFIDKNNYTEAIDLYKRYYLDLKNKFVKD